MFSSENAVTKYSVWVRPKLLSPRNYSNWVIFWLWLQRSPLRSSSAVLTLRISGQCYIGECLWFSDEAYLKRWVFFGRPDGAEMSRETVANGRERNINGHGGNFATALALKISMQILYEVHTELLFEWMWYSISGSFSRNCQEMRATLKMQPQNAQLE